MNRPKASQGQVHVSQSSILKRKLKYHLLTVRTKNEDQSFFCVLCGINNPIGPNGEAHKDVSLEKKMQRGLSSTERGQHTE